MKNYTEPHFTSSAVITIDTQCDTLDGYPLEIPGTSAALPHIKLILDAYREQRLPIVHIVRIYRKDGSNVDLCRKEAFENGTHMLLEESPGCELAPEMFHHRVRLDSERLLSGGIQKIGDHEVILYKPRWGAFYKTPLESHVRALGVDTLVFVGCNFPNCPRTSLYEASERDFKLVLVEDAVSGFYPKGREEMLNIGVQVTTAEHIHQEIQHMTHIMERDAKE